MNDEPSITINDHILTSSQANTVRVALGHFASNLREHGLGDDLHGQEMTRIYLQRIEEIQAMNFDSLGDAVSSKSTFTA